VLGTEPEIVSNYVDNGKVRLVYWPVLDHGASVNAHAAAECVGQQSVDAFWTMHDGLYLDQSELWSADIDYFADAAERAGVDRQIFMECFDSGEGHETVKVLDQQRRELGVYQRPTFDLEGTLLFGNQSFNSFSAVIDAILGAK